jgi:UDP-N-acetylmuramoylalanine--D-glutamate ligase
MVKRIAILGGGESGVGAAILAKKRGFEVFLSDKGKIDEKYKNVLSQFEIRFEEGKHTWKEILVAGEIIKSPGIPAKVDIVMQALERKIPVISEIEFAGRFSTGKKICITGSNGKTTTTLLIYHILKNAGLNVGLGGNIGKSFAWLVAEEEHDYWVLEISSFQLDGMFDFKADIAVLLNITPDHLDRYNNNFDQYTASKFRIIQNQTAVDAFIFGIDDPVIAAGIEKYRPKARLFPFSIKQIVDGPGAYLIENSTDFLKSRMYIKTNSDIMEITLQEMALRGKHNVYNSTAAAVSGRLLEIRKERIKESLANFHGAEHRLEYVATIRGVDYINDSKATNVNSTWYALEEVTRPVIWIAGGQDKGNDYSILLPLVKAKVKAIICLGIDNTKIHRDFQLHVPLIIDADTAEDAVQLAYTIAEREEIVLLSPACASFDLFKNYEDRGNQFKEAVYNL